MLTRAAYRHWLRRRRRRRIITCTLIFALAWGLLAAIHPSASHRHHRAAPAARARQATRSRTGRLPATVATAGQGLHWADFHGIALPASATDGPRRTRDGLAWGFADTPRGALLAAVNIGVRTAALWGPAIYGPTVTRQVTGADAAALLAADTRDYAALRAAARVKAGQPAGRGYAAETGYRFAAWAPGDATVDIVTAGPGSSGTTVLAVTRIQVLWLHGDWRVVAPPGGNWATSASSITSLAGYTPFPDAR
jgi:hypothetical protein